MKYPYIGESTVTERKVLFTLPGVGFDFSRMKMKGVFDESIFKNITAEYLANTYGEVKSKEHAEFIKLLAENAGIDVFPQLLDANHFVIKGKLSFHNCERITSSELKQITIPLPPECESVDEWPKVNDDVFYKGQKWTFVAKHNDMAMLFWTGDEYCTAKISELQKPKTPEQELRDELVELTLSHMENKDHPIEANAYYLVSEIIEKYITKKGKGDE